MRAISLKAARVEANLTQKQIAEKMGIHYQTYANLEKNPGGMSINAAKKFSKIVGIPLSDIDFS